MAGDSTVSFSLLHRTCKLVVLLCLLHISVTVVFYVRSLDLRFAFVQNQQSHNNVTQPNQVRVTVLPSRTEPKEAETKNEVPAEVQQQDQQIEPKPPGEQRAEEPVKKLERCPETSPLLGKTRFDFSGSCDCSNMGVRQGPTGGF